MEYRVQIINDVYYLYADDRNQAVRDGADLYLKKHPMSKYSKSSLRLMGHAKKTVRYDDDLNFKGFRD